MSNGIRRAGCALAWSLSIACMGCGAPPAETVSDATCGSTLPRVRGFDPDRAAHGEALLRDQTLASGGLPELVVRNLWVAWGTAPPASDAAYWSAFRDRYGMLEAPFDNGGRPLGVRSEGGAISLDCLACHAGRVAGKTFIGAPNTRIDLETFYDDLLTMRELAPMYGFAQPPVPYDLDGLTSARGAHDAFGIGFRVFGVSGINTRFGPQSSPAWWAVSRKERMHWDGSADASGHRSMMATLVAFGASQSDLAAREADFADIAQFIHSLPSPCWDLTVLDAEKLARGRQLFEARCASCHGVHSGDAAQYPNLVVSRESVATDPIRAERFGEPEATAINASWIGQPPFMPTGGYLAPPLIGVWATAPYFHNGSVPDLLGVLDPAERPTRWTSAGTELSDYDVARVGLSFTEVDDGGDPTTREGRRIYDTTREGMSNTGHLYGESLTTEERADLLEYLRSL